MVGYLNLQDWPAPPPTPAPSPDPSAEPAPSALPWEGSIRAAELVTGVRMAPRCGRYAAHLCGQEVWLVRNGAYHVTRAMELEDSSLQASGSLGSWGAVFAAVVECLCGLAPPMSARVCAAAKSVCVPCLLP